MAGVNSYSLLGARILLLLLAIHGQRLYEQGIGVYPGHPGLNVNFVSVSAGARMLLHLLAIHGQRLYEQGKEFHPTHPGLNVNFLSLGRRALGLSGALGSIFALWVLAVGHVVGSSLQSVGKSQRGCREFPTVFELEIPSSFNFAG